jgi:HAD superfamily hydrolase (TIGR01450 family)
LRSLGLIENFFFDLDGCIWFGDQLAPHAAELVAQLRQAGKRVSFVSNITSSTGPLVAAKLTQLGIPATEAEVMTPFTILADHPLLLGDKRVFLLGNDLMWAALAGLGLRLVDQPLEADVVVVSRDPELTYVDLAEATQALDNGAALLALNLDARVPVEGGLYLPGNGAIVAALTTATGAEAHAIGKPSSYFFERALTRFRADRRVTVMVGDNLDSDIAGGLAAGLITIHVGGANFTQLPVAPQAHYSVEGLAQLAKLLIGAGSLPEHSATV